MSLQEISESNQRIYSELCDIRAGKLQLGQDTDYGQLLKNKSVAVVGPARTLLGKKQGQLIDSYDIVVRFNDFFECLPVVPSLADDIGIKADILYCNQVILRKNILEEKGVSNKEFIKICKEVDIKYFVCTNNSLSFEITGESAPSCAIEDRQLIHDFERFLSQHEMKTKFRLVYTASHLLSKWLQGNWGRTGFIAILDLLGFDISRLYITGMTFYHGGGHLFAPNSFELHPLKNRDGTWAKDRSGLGHNSYLELDLMRLFVQCFHHKLEVDEDLLMLLEHENA